jgi:hypothetical protein
MSFATAFPVALRARGVAFAFLAAFVISLQSGCVSQFACDAIPANRLPCELSGERRSCKVPIDFSTLKHPEPDTYRLGAGDKLMVYIQDILPSNSEQLPVLQGSMQQNSVYYPPGGILKAPAVGVPVDVQSDGTLILPLVTPINVDGMTMQEAADQVRKAYTVDKQIIVAGRERILLTLVKSRTARVLVVRDDADGGNSVKTLRREEAVLARRGSAAPVDLPAFENDVLHALLATGGLPGVDAYSDVVVIHGSANEFDPITMELEAGADPSKVATRLGTSRHVVRIPLRVNPGEPLPFGPQDVVLKNGDIVYIETRQTEFFYVGGLLPGGQIPLPRDYDLDIIGAIALANGSVAGPAGQNAATVLNVRSGPGNIIPPTRAIVLRTLPDGEQIKIRVNINEAVNNPKERLRILPGDVVMLNYKPHEVVGNTLLNLVNFSVGATGIFGGN